MAMFIHNGYHMSTRVSMFTGASEPAYRWSYTSI